MQQQAKGGNLAHCHPHNQRDFFPRPLNKQCVNACEGNNTLQLPHTCYRGVSSTTR